MLKIIIATFAMATSAMAQPACAPHDIIADRLESKYGETPRIMALMSNGGVMEIFSSEATGTWSVTVTVPGGLTCLVAAGTGIEDIPKPANT